MGDSQDVNFVACDQVGQVVGVARHWRPPNVESFRQPLDSRSG